MYLVKVISMQNLLVFSFLSMLSFSVAAENSIFGKWKDKNDPSSYKYEFKKNNDFIYTNYWKSKGDTKSTVKKGVWEIGEWTITQPSGNKSTCGLMIYADTTECCFSFKFIANNLILTNKYSSISFNGMTIGMCANKVLIKNK